MDYFDQAVKVHEVLGETADPVCVRVANHDQVRTLRRLAERSKPIAHSILDRHTEYPEAADALDEQLDDYVFEPNRRAIARRGVALERWLADHGFRSGTPIRFVRAHRHLHHHGGHIELPVARPVIRESFHGVDEFLTDQLLDNLHGRSQPAVRQPGRVSVVPGFILLELSTPEFMRQFDVVNDQSMVHGQVIISNIEPGPVMVTTRDISGEMIAHALKNELAHELAAMGDYKHVHSFPTPAELLHRPERIRDIVPPHNNPKNIDTTAHQILAERLRHLPSECRLAGPLTLTDLGFTPYDWVPIEQSQNMSALNLHAASVYLASLLLGKVFIETINCHPETYSTIGYHPAQAFADADCSDSWHPHYHAANTYVNFVRTTKAGAPGPKFLDGLYRKTVDPTTDFSHGRATNHPVRFHVYSGPLHPLA